MAGRWGISSQQSGEYVLTARTVITNLQATILKGISGRTPKYDEDELKSDYWSWLQSRRCGIDPLDLVNLISVDPGNVECVALSQAWPVKRSSVEEVVIDVTVEPVIEPEALLMETPIQELDPKPGEIYWVSVGKHGFRRLHKVDGCRTPKTMCWNYLTAAQAVQEKSDRPCLLCWEDLKGGEMDSSDSGSSSSSSSEGTDDGAMIDAMLIQAEVAANSAAALG
jgi:hypothetical protein